LDIGLLFPAHYTSSNAAEIRFRGERRVGELIIEQKVTVGLNPGTRPNKEHGGSMKAPGSIPTLADAGIDKKLSSRAQFTFPEKSESEKSYFRYCPQGWNLPTNLAP
jgi:hypothetical protein